MDWLNAFAAAFRERLIEEIKIGDIGEEIKHGILQKYLDIGNFSITDAILVSWIAILLMAVLFGFMSRKPKLIPTTKQTIMELLVGLVVSVAMSFGMNRKEAEHVAPMILTIGTMITGCNVISFVKVSPPAKNIAFPVAMAIFAIVYVVYISIRFVGLKGFWKSLTEPMAMMLPFKILDMLIKPVSLALRLFGNVFGAYVFMEFLSIIIPVIIPGILGLWFDITDGILQAVVFSYLTMSYIGEIVEVGHELQEHPEKFQKKKKKKTAEAVEAAA